MDRAKVPWQRLGPVAVLHHGEGDDLADQLLRKTHLAP